MVQRRPWLGKFATIVVVGLWLAALAVPPTLLLRMRAGWLAELDRPEAQARWDELRRDMRRQTGRDGPVQRKVPKSAEPPARVWLRDYFQLAVVAWVLFVGVLGGFFSLLVAGVLRREPVLRDEPTRISGEPAAGRSLSQDEAGRQGDDDEQHERDAENTE